MAKIHLVARSYFLMEKVFLWKECFDGKSIRKEKDKVKGKKRAKGQ
jgi:hypothetical protein